MLIETEGIEFKEKFTEDIYKEVIAFANTGGGSIYVGIDDDRDAFEEERSLNQDLNFTFSWDLTAPTHL